MREKPDGDKESRFHGLSEETRRAIVHELKLGRKVTIYSDGSWFSSVGVRNLRQQVDELEKRVAVLERTKRKLSK